jgi:hypothetical protein
MQAAQIASPRITRWGGRNCGADRPRRRDGLHCSSVSSEAVNRRRVMDQPPTPARYLACNRDAPRCGGGDLGRHEGPRCGGARRLICSLSNGETRSGAGRRPCFLLPGEIPLHGEVEQAEPSHHGSAQTGRLGRRDGPKRKVRAADGPPFSFPRLLLDVLHDQHRRLVAVVIPPANNPQRSPARVDQRPDRPVRPGGAESRRIRSCAALELEPEQKPCHPILLSAWGRTAPTEYSGTSEGRVTTRAPKPLVSMPRRGRSSR